MSRANVVTYGDAETLMTELSNAIKTGDAAGRTLLKDTVGWTGKNLNSYPYLHTTKTESGITFNDNGDGTVTVNGTATADAVFQCHFRANTDNRNNLILPNGKYILSGCPSGGASSKYLMGANRTLNGAHDLLGADFGDGVEITLNGDDYSADKVDIGIYIQIKNGTTVNNLIFKPMLRRADISDSTYEPYHESVEVMYEEEIHGVNLCDWRISTQTKNGITWTQNADGTVTANGTAGETQSDLYSAKFKFKEKGKYILSGSPAGGNRGINYGFGMYNFSKSVWTWEGGETATIEVDDLDAEWWYSYVVRAGKTVTNAVFKPMLRKADIEDSTYRPYNEQAIQNQLNDKGVLGAKNLFNFDTPTVTRSGVTFENNGGIITANGTGTDVGYPYIECRKTLPAGTYIFTGCPSGGGDVVNPDNYQIILRLNDPSGPIIALDYGDGSTFTLDQSSVVSMRCMTSKNMTVTNLIYKPMLRLASDPDDTYQPYAMTNRELTDKMPKAIQHTIVWNEDLNLDTNKGGNILQYGNVYLVTYWFKATGSFTGNTPIIKLPKTSLICGNYVITENNDAAIWGGRATKDGNSYISISCPITEGNSYRAQCVFIDTEN